MRVFFAISKIYFINSSNGYIQPQDQKIDQRQFESVETIWKFDLALHQDMSKNVSLHTKI